LKAGERAGAGETEKGPCYAQMHKRTSSIKKKHGGGRGEEGEGGKTKRVSISSLARKIKSGSRRNQNSEGKN